VFFCKKVIEEESSIIKEGRVGEAANLKENP